MTVEIISGETADLPAAECAAELLPSGGDTLILAASDAASAYTVLRTVMDYGYEHDLPRLVRLVCADDAVYRAFLFQWNMWYAERKPGHGE